ncbi:hypothetical protein B0J18DRAFT_466773 [Chaetomium sp. MPI-SDFR-AT-0129]|nr:hypothetical protein B0J18DRAFT_466773 [Chaetomium sp. MPI-SDFR-AT-0129]
MSSDQDYAAFLEKANEDPSQGAAQSSSATSNKPGQFRTTQQGVTVPAPISEALDKGDAFYISDADEPFDPVALQWDEAGEGLPDEEEFANLIQHWDPKNAEVQILDPYDWDSHGKYGGVIEAVREAGQGNDVRVYRVVRDGTRVEYFVVTTEGKGKGAKLVGVKALAVES